MAHHLRHDRTCLNCGATVEKRYCTGCGQENLEPKETVGHLIRHFFEDITHFDGKFFTTLKDLIIKPGFLTSEYVAGRRMSYLNPIRMYIFISAIFFVTLFASTEESKPPPEDHTSAVNMFRQHLADSLRSAKAGDTLQQSFNGKMAARLDSVKFKKASDESVSLNYGSAGKVTIDIHENKYNTLREYDSVQHTLPDSLKDQGMMHWLMRNNVRQKVLHGGRENIHMEVDVSHDIPKVMFLILPLFALYVSWFYSRKKYYYVNHAIFSVHFHCFVFIFFLFLLLLGKVIPGEWTELILLTISPIPIFVYLVAALHGMYRQSFWLSLGKGFAIGLLYVITLSITSTLLMIIAFILV